jgi:RiboL-PSP-HEPN
MPSSQRYREMTSELTRLRHSLLPKKVSPTGVYSSKQPDRTRAYKVLSHAEIESYIEDIVLSKVNSAYDMWVSQSKPSQIMTCLVAVSNANWEDEETQELDLKPLEPIKFKPNSQSLDLLMDKVINQYRKIVKDNHGIKDKNIKRLVMPLGISITELDQVWLSSMTTFGSIRGLYVHSSRIGIRNIPDPFSEKSTVDSLLPGLLQLEQIISSKI